MSQLLYAVAIDQCVEVPCNNGATCIDGVGDYTCLCVPGFTGRQCETGICTLRLLVPGFLEIRMRLLRDARRTISSQNHVQIHSYWIYLVFLGCLIWYSLFDRAYDVLLTVRFSSKQVPVGSTVLELTLALIGIPVVTSKCELTGVFRVSILWIVENAIEVDDLQPTHVDEKCAVALE